MFDLETFKKASQSMIATNENSYRESYLNWERVKPVREYTVQEVKDIVRSGSEDGQRELSRNYSAICSTLITNRMDSFKIL